jgi:selT/selW/selH-like putative selenoprotein
LQPKILEFLRSEIIPEIQTTIHKTKERERERRTQREIEIEREEEMAARRCLLVGGRMARALSARQVPCLGQSGSLSLMEQRRVVSTKTFEPGFHWRKIVQAHHLSCCPANDNPPPREVIVEYCEESDLTDFFIELAEKVENAHPELAVLGNPDGIKPRKGAFEMTTDDHLMWSTLKKKRLPKFEDILDAIADLPPKCEMKSDDAKTVPIKAANA